MGRTRVIVAYVAVVTLLATAGWLPVGFLHRPAVETSGLIIAFVATLPTSVLALIPVAFGLPVPVVACLTAIANVLTVHGLRRVGPGRLDGLLQQRLAEALTATQVPVTPMARGRRTGRTEAGRRFRERSLLLRDVPMAFRDLAGLYRTSWQQAGLRLQEREQPPALRASDAEGYVLQLEAASGYFGDVVLQVSSPPRRYPGVPGGLAVSVIPALLLAGGVLALPLRPGSATWAVVGAQVLLVALEATGGIALLGGVVYVLWPLTRALGIGLLGGAATTGVLLLFMINHAGVSYL
ncbi:hypothetical protein [Actinoplanes sp. TFC3]|uniref:hypothetical protein n=1 Tax=Actinoplanes sp. TFC3 TaxID=1710355 RepID=UPI0008342868|nr:hypothetical protein [Actinoplanes sp. TFC3]